MRSGTVKGCLLADTCERLNDELPTTHGASTKASHFLRVVGHHLSDKQRGDPYALLPDSRHQHRFLACLGAALVLLPWWFREWGKQRKPAVFSVGSSLAGIFLGLHFATWAWALQHTTIANAMLFIGLQPLLAPFVARPLLGERLNRWEGMACALACLGMVWILGRQLAYGSEQLAGVVLGVLKSEQVRSVNPK